MQLKRNPAIYPTRKGANLLRFIIKAIYWSFLKLKVIVENF